MPQQWYQQLGYYDKKVAKDIAKHIFSEFRMLFWRDELHMRAREYARYPLAVVKERMRMRRNLSDAACYDQIFDRLAIPQHFPKPVERQFPQVDENCEERYDRDMLPMEVVATSIRHDLFHIREGLRFTKPENFLMGMGIRQQQWITDCAYERYQDCCENLFHRMGVVRRMPIPRHEMNQQCLELVEDARWTWEHRMQNWMEDSLGIQNQILIEVDGHPIRRRLMGLWNHGNGFLRDEEPNNDPQPELPEEEEEEQEEEEDPEEDEEEEIEEDREDSASEQSEVDD